jgi:hypothetical protein
VIGGFSLMLCNVQHLPPPPPLSGHLCLVLGKMFIQIIV